MLINCPHCQHKLEVVQSGESQSVPCPSCGSNLYVLNDTLTMKPQRAQFVAHFELIQAVEQGHYGTVWKARDTNLNRIVALKIPHALELTPGMVRLYMHEAQSAARLKHENIVGVYDVKIEDGRVYIVSEFIDGVSMAEYLTEHKAPPREAAELCATLAEALHYAHEQKIVHRDLKPGNVLLDKDRRPHIADFGLAKQLGETITINMQGHVLGTPAYMSPEQARGDGHFADARSDVYSLGVMLYEMLAGQRPFKGGSKLLIFQVLNDDPAPPGRLNPKTPRDLETICLKAMHKDPARRFQSAAEMAADLRRYLAGKPILARRASRGERAWRWARRNPVVTSLLGVVGLLVVALSSVLAYDVATAPPAPRRYKIEIATEPAGGTVVFMPRDRETGEPLLERAVERKQDHRGPLELPAGEYFVVAYSPDEPALFHEVFRRVPGEGDRLPGSHRHQSWKRGDDGTVVLPPIKLWREAETTLNMARLEGAAKFAMGTKSGATGLRQIRNVPPFWLDLHETTIAEFRAGRGSFNGPLRTEDRPGDLPVTYVLLDQAIAFAEQTGKFLMNETQYEFAATNGGRTRFPWGDDESVIQRGAVAKVGEPEYDRTLGNPPVTGLYSNVQEWTVSWYVDYPLHPERSSPGHFATLRGGPGHDEQTPLSAWLQGPTIRASISPKEMYDGLGFRCARSIRPHLHAEDFTRVAFEPQ